MVLAARLEVFLFLELEEVKPQPYRGERAHEPGQQVGLGVQDDVLNADRVGPGEEIHLHEILQAFLEQGEGRREGTVEQAADHRRRIGILAGDEAAIKPQAPDQEGCQGQQVGQPIAQSPPQRGAHLLLRLAHQDPDQDGSQELQPHEIFHGDHLDDGGQEGQEGERDEVFWLAETPNHQGQGKCEQGVADEMLAVSHGDRLLGEAGVNRQ